MRRVKFLGAAALLWTMLPGWADAMVYVPMTFKALVTEARVIVVGRVTATDAQWTDGRRSIETLVTIDAEQYLKGDMGRSLTIRVPGGQVGPYLSLMPGAPRFSPGDQVVLFLAGDGPSIPHVLGLGQGVFRVVTSAPSGARTVIPELLTAAGAGAVAIVRGDPARRPAPLDRFAADVRALAAAPPVQGAPAR